MKKPNFFIVGAPKCGTTSMYIYLKKHPEIFMSKEKEPHFFGSDLPHNNCITKKGYQKNFKGAKKEKRVGEASTWYLYSKNAAKEIKNFNPNAKIIIMLRNPINFLYSLHSYCITTGREDILDFEEAIESKKKQQPTFLNIAMPTGKGNSYKKVASFSGQIKRYLDLFGKEKVHFVIFEDFKKNPQEEYKKILRFLEVDTEFIPEFKIWNKTTIRIRNPHTEILRKYIKRNKILRKIFSFFIKKNSVFPVLKVFKKFFPDDYKERKKMTNEMKRKLEKEFYKEIKETGKLVGKDLIKKWGIE